MKFKTLFLIAFTAASTYAIERLLRVNGKGFLESIEDEVAGLKTENKTIKRDLELLKERVDAAEKS